MSNQNTGAEAVKKPGVFSRIGRGFRNMRGEMSRVVWPSRKQVMNNTAVVLVFMAIAAVIIGGFDTGLSWILRQAFGA
ncbi:MAG: preprotein translocase subunit SecE [Oscillospiraceae bacterium]|nr:preprotein translocase subunit SecE [Oscillospiraceae bacterium]